MQLSALLSTIALVASTAAAAPAGQVSMMAAGQEWTIEQLQRKCDNKDSVCDWTFSVNTHEPNVKPTACKLTVKGAGSTVASRSNGGPVNCGPYTVTSGWSGHFGDGQGFTVLSVVDNKKHLIVWPGYTDKQVEGGEVVTPDQSYTPTSLKL
ncbi:hypothetical protein CDD81_7595 [Ophiocordyceps australis]|uniref:Small secreted protein n=1 Tax=Ophiocordyceps australis TaxID=1399860 RepID=A0A2C5Y4E2_9HYPO|nr:hypothetical protein CDD81_7595 [Ophiocordyceps australis]